MKIRNTLTIAVTAALLASSASLFAASYKVTDLVSNGVGSQFDRVNINSKGQILAVAGTTGFLYTNGVQKVINDTTTNLPFSYNIFKGFNDNGQVVGSSTVLAAMGLTSQGFVWGNGIAKVLSVPSSAGRLAGSSTANFINNKGQILGTSDYITDKVVTFRGRPTGIDVRGHHVTLWNKNGTVSTDLTPTLNDTTETAAPIGINNNGQVILRISKFSAIPISIFDTTGIQYYSESGSSFIWENGILTPLESVGSTPDSWAYDINDKGQVVGGSNGQAILWDDHENGKATVLAALGGTSYAFAINNQGEIIGHGKDADNTSHAAIWNDWDNSVTDLGANVALKAINKKGQVVGYDANFIPFVWEQGGSKITLPSLPSVTPASSTINTVAINDKGQIVGTSPTTDSYLHIALWQLGK